MTGAEPDKKQNRDSAGGAFCVPSNEAGFTPRFVRDARNALRFPEKSGHNQKPLIRKINAVSQRGPDDAEKQRRTLTESKKSGRTS